MEELLNLLNKIDEITEKLNNVMSDENLSGLDKFNSIKDTFSNLIGQDALQSLTATIQQFRALSEYISEIQTKFNSLSHQIPYFENAIKPINDVLNESFNRNIKYTIEQQLTGDLDALKYLKENFSSDKSINYDINVNLPNDMKEKIQNAIKSNEVDLVINQVRNEKLGNLHSLINSNIDNVSHLFTPLQITSATDTSNTGILQREILNLADAFADFRQKLKTATELSFRDSANYNNAAREIELAVNRELQALLRNYPESGNREYYDTAKKLIEQGVARLNAELPEENKIKIVSDDILSKQQVLTSEDITKAFNQNLAKIPELSYVENLSLIRDRSSRNLDVIDQILKPFTSYREKLSISGNANDPFSMMTFLGMNFENEISPMMKRFADKLKEAQSIIETSPTFKRESRNLAELTLNQQALEAIKFDQEFRNDLKQKYETGKIDESAYNRALKDADYTLKEVFSNLEKARLSVNAEFATQTGLRPIVLADPDYLKEKIRKGETSFTTDELKSYSKSIGFNEGLERVQAELYQSMINMRDGFAKISGNFLMNSAWAVAFTAPMALMNALIFEPYSQTSRILQPSFIGLGQATGIPQIVQQMTDYASSGFLRSTADIYDKLSSLTAIYRNPQTAQDVVNTALQTARYQPIQFSEATELLKSFAIYPGTRSVLGTNETSRRQLLESAQYLQMLSPEQGVSGAIIALREFFSGEFRSLKMRFEIDPGTLAASAGVSLKQMLSAPDDKKIEYLNTALSNILGRESLFYKSANIDFQIQNFNDVLQQTLSQAFATKALPSLTAYYTTTPQATLIRQNMMEELTSRGYSEEDAKRITDIRLQLRQTLGGSIAGIIEDFNNVFGKFITMSNTPSNISNFLSQFILQIQNSILEFDTNLEKGDTNAFGKFSSQISKILTNMIKSVEKEFQNNPNLQALTDSIGNVTATLFQKMFTATTSIVGKTIANAVVELPSTVYGVTTGLFSNILPFKQGNNENPEITKYLWNKPSSQDNIMSYTDSIENLRSISNALVLLGSIMTPGGVAGKTAAFLGLSFATQSTKDTMFEDIVNAGLSAYTGYMVTQYLSRNVSNLPYGFSTLGKIGGALAITGIEGYKYAQGQSGLETIGNLMMELSALHILTNLDKFKFNPSRFRVALEGASGIGGLLRGLGTGAMAAAPFLAGLPMAGIALFAAGAGLSYVGDKLEDRKIKEQTDRIREATIGSLSNWIGNSAQQLEQLVESDNNIFYGKIKDSYKDVINRITEADKSRQIPVILNDMLGNQNAQNVMQQIFGKEKMSELKPDTIFDTYQGLVDTSKSLISKMVSDLQKGEPLNVKEYQADIVRYRDDLFRKIVAQNPEIDMSEASNMANRATKIMIETSIKGAEETIRRNAEYVSTLHENIANNRDIIQKLFTNQIDTMQLPELQLNLSGNINQQIQAFIQKLDSAISSAIDSYIDSIDLSFESYSFKRDYQDKLDDLNEKIDLTMSNNYSKFFSIGRQLRMPRKDLIEFLKKREEIADKLADDNPEAALNEYLSIANAYATLHKRSQGKELFNKALSLNDRVSEYFKSEFDKRYMKDAPDEIKSIPQQLFDTAKSVAQFDPDQALKIADRAAKYAQRMANLDLYDDIVKFEQNILKQKNYPLEQLQEYGGRIPYIQNQLLKATSPDIIKQQASQQITSLQQFEDALSSSLAQLGNYSFPQLKSAISQLDSSLSQNLQADKSSNNQKYDKIASSIPIPNETIPTPKQPKILLDPNNLPDIPMSKQIASLEIPLLQKMNFNMPQINFDSLIPRSDTIIHKPLVVENTQSSQNRSTPTVSISAGSVYINT